MPHQSKQLFHKDNISRDNKGAVKEVDLYSAFIVLPANYTNDCLYLVSVHQMAPPQTEVADI